MSTRFDNANEHHFNASNAVSTTLYVPSEYHEIQVEVVQQTAACVNSIEYSDMKSKLLPKLCQLALATKKLAVREHTRFSTPF